MTPQAFIAHWIKNDITERSGAQQHFNDLCELLDQEKPRDVNNYCFERGAKTSSGQGWADVWKRGFFAWEYKAPNKDLNAALKQLMNYALALDNPPLLVVCDLRTIEIHTHFTGHPSEVHRIQIQDLTKPEVIQKLKWLFTDPERFKPKLTTYTVTERAANKIGEIAERLNQKGNAPHDVAHFLIQCVFCMFAEDSKILPDKLFESVMDRSNPDGSKAQKRLSDLFEAMQGGGDFAMNDIPWFNGGLFKNILVPALETEDVVSLLDSARMDWSQIEPAILGTLFERGLNPDMRSQLGAHYTDPATIMKIIRPIIEQPLLAEWQPAKIIIAENIAKYIKGGKGSQNALTEAQNTFLGFLQRLRDFRVLDPACGSGNFLYLALKTLKDLEHRVNLEAESLGLHRELNIETSPANVLGIEINPYAAELARVTVWIGEIQWMLLHGYQYRKNPILAPLDHIENRDAVLSYSHLDSSNGLYSEPIWPTVDVIIGNPPFLGDKKMKAELGEIYTNELRKLYADRITGNSDFVTYWFEKARSQIIEGKAKYAGLVATNSIRQKGNRQVLQRIVSTLRINESWSDEEWVNAGAAVRVSLVCFGNITNDINLNGKSVAAIHADLTSGTDLDLTKACPLETNKGWSYFGLCLAGAFKINEDEALKWLKHPNPNNKPNSDVLKPIYNGADITGRSTGKWVIDFGFLDENEASMYETPYTFIAQHVKPTRLKNNRPSRAEKWWKHGEARPGMRSKISNLERYIVTPETSKHRFFVFLPTNVAPEHRLVVIPHEDYTCLGILSSRIHLVWALAIGGTLEDRPVYNSSLCFEAFPFPEGLTPNLKVYSNPYSSNINDAAERLDQIRNNWLNPTEWVEWKITPEEQNAGFPLRAAAKGEYEIELKKRTLTNLYNLKPTWLENAHKSLDESVANAYGWKDYTSEMPDEEILRRLLKLNHEQTKAN